MIDESYDNNDEIDQRRIKDRLLPSVDDNKSNEPLDLPSHQEKFGTPHRGLQFSPSTVDLPSSRTISSVTDSEAGAGSRILSSLQQQQDDDNNNDNNDINNNNNNNFNQNLQKRMENLVESGNFQDDDLDNNNNNQNNGDNNNKNGDKDNQSISKYSINKNPPSIHELLLNNNDQDRASIFLQNILSGQSQRDLINNQNDNNYKNDINNTHSKIDYANSEDATTISNEDNNDNDDKDSNSINDGNDINNYNHHNNQHNTQHILREESKIPERRQPSISPLTEMSGHQSLNYLNHLFPNQSELSSKFYYYSYYY